jgi:hypothetical protein
LSWFESRSAEFVRDGEVLHCDRNVIPTSAEEVQKSKSGIHGPAVYAGDVVMECMVNNRKEVKQ